MFITKMRCHGGRSFAASAPPSRCRCSMRWCRRRRRWRRPLAHVRRASASSTCRTAPTWRRGRRRPPARGFELSPTLQTLEPFKDSLVVVSNLKRAGGQAEMHAAAASGWLSGAIPKRTEAEDFACGTTIDQVLARQIGQSSPFPSLEFAHRGLHRLRRRLHAGLQLRLSRLDRLGVADDAAADGDQSARARSSGCSATAARDAQRQQQPARGPQHPRRHPQRNARAADAARRARPRARRPTTCDDVREIERRIQRSEAQQRADVTHGQAARHPGLVRGAHAR